MLRGQPCVCGPRQRDALKTFKPEIAHEIEHARDGADGTHRRTLAEFETRPTGFPRLTPPERDIFPIGTDGLFRRHGRFLFLLVLCCKKITKPSIELAVDHGRLFRHPREDHEIVRRVETLYEAIGNERSR